MTLTRYILAAAVLVITVPPVFADDDPCLGVTGPRHEACLVAKRTPNPEEPCKVLSFRQEMEWRERYKQCLSAVDRVNRVTQGLVLEGLLKLAICTSSYDWKTCLGIYVIPVPDAVPDPGPYVQTAIAALPVSDRLALHKNLRAAIDANARYLTKAADEIYGSRTK